MNFDQDQLQYLAGLIDGRGTVGIKSVTQNGKTYHYPMVRMCVTEGRWGLIDQLHKQIGGCLSSCDQEGYRKFWEISGKKAVTFITAVQPHVKSNKRKKEIRTVLRKAK